MQIAQIKNLAASTLGKSQNHKSGTIGLAQPGDSSSTSKTDFYNTLADTMVRGDTTPPPGLTIADTSKGGGSVNGTGTTSNGRTSQSADDNLDSWAAGVASTLNKYIDKKTDGMLAGRDLTDAQRQLIADYRKQFKQNVADAVKQYSKGGMTKDQLRDKLNDARGALSDQLSSVLGIPLTKR